MNIINILSFILIFYYVYSENMRGNQDCNIVGQTICSEPCTLHGEVKRCSIMKKWMNITLPYGMICVQNGLHIELMNSSSTMISTICPNGVKNNTAYCHINGWQQCVSECECNQGYHECVDHKWNFVYDEKAICQQVSHGRVSYLQSDKEYTYCTLLKGPYYNSNCKSVVYPTCTNGQERCINQCDCTGYYEVCSEGRWIMMPLPEGTVCVQNNTEIFFLNSCIDDTLYSQYCSNFNNNNCNCNICHDGDQICINECGCYDGYKVCTNNQFVQMFAPAGTVCYQDTPTTVILELPCNSDSHCYNKPNSNCDCQNSPKCINGEQYCSDQCNCNDNKYIECVNGEYYERDLPSGTVCYENNSQIIMESSCPGVDTKNKCFGKTRGNCPCLISNPVCNEGDMKCISSCDCGNNQYSHCINGKWEVRQLPSDTLCYQNSSTSIIQVSKCPEMGSLGQCEGFVTGHCDCASNKECVYDEYKCINECQCGFGYKQCVDGKFVDMPIPDKEVCSQISPKDIEFVSSCPSYGDMGKCQDKTYNSCICPDKDVECINGETMCLNQCECGYGYKICANGKWVTYPLNDKNTVCAQNGTNIVLEYACPIDGQNEICRTRSDSCKCSSPEIICIQGEQRCLDECGCDNNQYQECINNKWITKSLPESTICYQNGSTIIQEFKCQSLGSPGQCYGNIHGDCDCVEDDIETCVDQCKCGKGYNKITDGNVIFIPIPEYSICTQYSTNKVKIIDTINTTSYGVCSSYLINSCATTNNKCNKIGLKCVSECEYGSSINICNNIDGNPIQYILPDDLTCTQNLDDSISIYSKSQRNCCTKRFFCTTPGNYCKNEYVKGQGYYNCDSNNNINYLLINDNQICVQLSENDISIKKIRLHQSSYEGHVINSCPLNRRYDNYIDFNDDYNKESDLNNNHIYIEYDSQSCTENGRYCSKLCSSEYYHCVNGTKYIYHTQNGYVCYYNTTSNDILMIEKNSQLCRNVQHDYLLPLTSNYQCTQPNGYFCEKNCAKNKGYYICKNKRSYYKQLENNQICVQNSPNQISILSDGDEIDSSYGCPSE